MVISMTESQQDNKLAVYYFLLRLVLLAALSARAQ
jgi:hypothetical protein